MSGPGLQKTKPPSSLPPELAQIGARSLPDLLLPYQKEIIAATSAHAVVVCEKSRRIGMTWGVGADAVLTAASKKSAGGMDVFYVGYNLDMTREFIDTCAMWARSFAGATATVEEFLFVEQDEKGADRSIQAFRIRFASGFEIVALCSRPRSLRGRQGYVIIDEGAFHDQLDELLKAALAFLIWGGKVLVISTHDGVENTFNALCTETRAGKTKYKLVRTTFDDALRAGLYQRVCLMRGMTWSAEGEAKWAKEIRDLYGDAATEELDCVPRRSAGRYLARAMLEARAVPVPVLRWSLDDAFVDKPEDERIATCLAWLEENVEPHLKNLAGVTRSFLGEDFGRSGDLTVLWPLGVESSLKRRTPFLIEMRNVPFSQQRQVIYWLIEHLPNFGGAAFDARGNGQQLAEEARQSYGPDAIAEVKLSEGWYREHMPPLKSAIEDGMMDLPRDADVIDDLRSLEVVNGVARVPDKSTKGSTGQRHGDAAIAAAIALFASRTLDAGPVDITVTGQRITSGAFGEPVTGRVSYAGWDD